MPHRIKPATHAFAVLGVILMLSSGVAARAEGPSSPGPSAPADPGSSPSTSPSASMTGDPELAALFPSAVAGVPLVVQTRTASEMLPISGQQNMQALATILAMVGKTLDDASFGLADFAGGSVDALRIRGADAASLLPQLLPLFEPAGEAATTTVTVAGKTVVQLPQSFAYPHGDVVWVVRAADPDLSEIFRSLP